MDGFDAVSVAFIDFCVLNFLWEILVFRLACAARTT